MAFSVLRDGALARSRDPSRGIEWIGLLPKSKYLTRVIELPPAPLDEFRDMVLLKTEATLPADYGPIETGFRRLGLAENGMERLEVYAAKRAHILAYTELLGKLEGRVVAVLPSASVWVDLLAEEGTRRDLLFAAPGPDSAGEAAFLNADGSLAVRNLGNGDTPALRRGVEETIRAANSLRLDRERELAVGWIGEALDPRSANRTGLNWIDESALLASTTGADDWLLGLAKGRSFDAMSEANMLPRALRSARVQRQMGARLLVGMAAGLASLALVVGALQVSTARHRNVTHKLEADIARIEKEGEAVGWRLAQLEALAAARSTRNDFAEVFYALHEACPTSGMSFSHLELDAEGTIRIRGQAESLAMPFELPQQLEGREVFADVMLRDAGQAKKGGGSVTEFRLEARHQRGKRP